MNTKTLRNGVGLDRCLLSLALVIFIGLFANACAQATPSEKAYGSQQESNSPSDHRPYKYEYSYPGNYNFADDDRATKPDSIRYYGPGRSWRDWNAAKLYDNETWTYGRDTWWFFTGGSERFYRALSVKLSDLEVSVEFFRALDTRRRDERFNQLGLINEPNFRRASEPNEYGLWLDEPIKGDAKNLSWEDDPYYPKDHENYGLPTGIVGLRMFKNRRFTDQLENEWKESWQKWWEASEKGTKLPDNPKIKSPVAHYMENPGRVEPPYLVGITCAFCHVAFDPTNPPADVNDPRWENLSANIGNQYFREGDLFFGWGKLSGGDADPIPGKHELDPYATKGLGDNNLLVQYGQLQQSGTSETSRFSYDFINNPNTINKIFYVGQRARFFETAPDGREVQTLHVLKDGADSVGIPAALARVFVNIGGEPEYWLERLWNPLAGSGPHPFSLAEVNLDPSVPEWRRRELKEKIPTIGYDWKRIVSRMPALANYLTSYRSPFYLKDAVDRAIATGEKNAAQLKELLPDVDRVRNGASMFARYCAKCHSNRQPTYPLTEADAAQFYKQTVLSGDFREGNTLTNDVRYPISLIGTNAARAFATNAIDGEIWAEFSSSEYKSLPSIGTMLFENPLNRISEQKFGSDPMQTPFVAPGGGRGYYRTASLVSLWATAPYLHNNAVGDDPYVVGKGISADVVQVEERMKMFNKAMRQMLVIEPRWSGQSIKVTSEDSGLLEGLDRTKLRIKSEAIWQILRPKIDKIVEGKLQREISDPSLRKIAAATFAEALEQARPKLPELLKKFEGSTLKEQIRPELSRYIREFAKQRITAKLQQAPLPDKLKSIIMEIADDDKIKLFEAISGDNSLPGISPAGLAFPQVPKGTPLNLILNQNIRNLPYVVQAIGKYKNHPRLLAEELLRISDCPDLVETRGHVFPTLEDRKADGVTKSDLEDLIEFLKTL